MSEQRITGVTGYHSQLVNRMRHGNFFTKADAYVLETHPAGYALIATNEAEKAAPIEVLFVPWGPQRSTWAVARRARRGRKGCHLGAREHHRARQRSASERDLRRRLVALAQPAR